MPRRATFAIALGALLSAAALTGCATGPVLDPRDDGAPGPASGGERGPAWSFTDTTGATQSRDAPERNASVLFFMATWCGSCRQTAPMLAAVEADYGARGARFYSLSWDPSETAEDLDAWRAQHGQDWPHGIDQGLATARAFSVTSQSSVVVLDAAGQVVQAWGYGQVRDSTLRVAIDRALASEVAQPQSPSPLGPSSSP